MRPKFASVTKKDFVDGISTELHLQPIHVQKVLNLFFRRLVSHLAKGGRAEFRDFGVFEVVTRKQKVGRNPKDATMPIIIPERSVVKFSPSKKLKTVVASENT